MTKTTANTKNRFTALVCASFCATVMVIAVAAPTKPETADRLTDNRPAAASHLS